MYKVRFYCDMPPMVAAWFSTATIHENQVTGIMPVKAITAAIERHNKWFSHHVLTYRVFCGENNVTEEYEAAKEV